MKAFAYLFIIYAIMNFPLMLFYVNGAGPIAKARVQSTQFTDVFAKLSIGNLGISDFTCSNFNMADKHQTLTFTCPYGTVRELYEFGMQKRDNETCKDKSGYYLGEGGAWDDIQLDCNFEYGMTPEGKQEFMDLFEADCFDQYECKLDFQRKWLSPECFERFEYYAAGSHYNHYAMDMNWTAGHLYQQDQRRREPVWFGTAFCVADQIYHPFSGEKLEMTK